jgi:putative transposase
MHRRESAGSLADLLRDCARGGMRAPVLAVGDGALRFWAALREVFPDTREQPAWVHNVANVLNALPKSAHPGATAASAEIYCPESLKVSINVGCVVWLSVDVRRLC